MTQATDSMRPAAPADPMGWTMERVPSSRDFVDDNSTFACRAGQVGSVIVAAASFNNGSLAGVWTSVAAYSFCSVMLGHEFAKAEHLHLKRQGQDPGSFARRLVRKSLRYLAPF